MAKALAPALHSQGCPCVTMMRGSSPFSSLPAPVPSPLTPLSLLLNTHVWSRVSGASRGSEEAFQQAVAWAPLSAPCGGVSPRRGQGQPCLAAAARLCPPPGTLPPLLSETRYRPLRQSPGLFLSFLS